MVEGSSFCWLQKITVMRTTLTCVRSWTSWDAWNRTPTLSTCSECARKQVLSIQCNSNRGYYIWALLSHLQFTFGHSCVCKYQQYRVALRYTSIAQSMDAVKCVKSMHTSAVNLVKDLLDQFNVMLELQDYLEEACTSVVSVSSFVYRCKANVYSNGVCSLWKYEGLFVILSPSDAGSCRRSC